MSSTRPNASPAANTRNRITSSPKTRLASGGGLTLPTSNIVSEEKNTELSKLEAILEDKESRSDQLIEVLQDMQTQFHYLPEDELRIVAERLGVPQIEVFRVAKFYNAFSLTPHGRHRLTICMGTACHVRGAPMLLDTAAGQLNVSPGETTADRAFTLERVNCLGCCAIGPVAVLDDVYHDHMTPGKLHKLINTVRSRDKERMKDHA
jgi:NADH-quinone oxidoreductase subunit E